jgi:ribosomal protein S20
MTRIQKIAVGGAVLLAVSGAGAAVAATKLRTPKAESQAIVNDVADQLGVTPQQVTNAFKTAMKNRIDQAVKDGRLTQAEGNRLKAEIDRQSVPMFGPGFGGRHDFEFRHVHRLDTAAKYLGMTEAQLRSALEDGKTLAQVAKDKGKSVDGLVNALLADARTHLNQKVEEGVITRAQADQMLSGLRERITDMVNGRMPAHPRFGHRFGFRGPPGGEFRGMNAPSVAPAF